MQQRDFSDSWSTNFKMVVHNVKRKSDDSGLDDTYDTPAKKVCIPTSASPDPGCFVGSVSSTSTPLENKQTVQTVNSSSSKKDSIASSGILPCLERSPDRSEKVSVNLGPAFDFDVEEILCLSPIKKCSCPTGVGNHLSCQVGVPEQNAVGEKVYFSRRYLEAMRRRDKDHTRLSASPLLVHTTSRPRVHRVDESEVFPGEPAVCQQKISFTLNDVSSTVSRAPLMGNEGTMEALDGDVDAWNIGNPLSESSTLSADCEKSVVGRGEMDCQGKLKEVEEVTVESSFENTLLKVQVKSEVVVVPSQKTESEPSQAVPETTSTKPNQSQRSVVFDSDADFHCAWQQYVRSVKRHIDESKGPIHEQQNQDSSAASGHQGQHESHLVRSASATVMSSADCESGIGIGGMQDSRGKAEGDVTAETSFEDTSFEDTPIKVQVKSKLVVIPSKVEGDVTVETSFEDTPIKVQVKSKLVVIPSKAEGDVTVQTKSKLMVIPSRRNIQAYSSTTTTDRSLRSFFNADYGRAKQQYVWAVRRHMEENLGAMAELQHMMYNVANQGRHSGSGHQWQHPSDLTVRNYRRPHKTHMRSLREWWGQNAGSGARFVTAPRTFQRSPVVFR